MHADQYRAEFDATVTFSNGGSLRTERFRVDVPGPDTTARQVGELFLASLNLLMVERVDLHGLRLFPEAHKGTHGGPSDTSTHPVPAIADRVWVELSHLIVAGMTTYPGIPGPEVIPHLTREHSRQVYAPGTEFAMDRISMIGNTGTYLDSPYHRYADGADLAALPLAAVADLPAVVVRLADSGERGIGPRPLAPLDLAGTAVLLHTGWDRHWGTEAYGDPAPFLTEPAAKLIVDAGARLVGIDSVNIDDTHSGGQRPAHSILLDAGIPVLEHLTGLADLPVTGARLHAAPPRVRDFGTFPVRAYAVVPR
jgi:arylformamidase